IPFTVYFSINKSIINDTEKAHMEQWLKLQNEQTRLLPVIVTGGADSSTGKIQYNTNLAKKRAEAVREILIEHGFKDVSIKTAVDDRLGPNAARNRAALIEQGN
ncbi:MAG: OmpA family protein, partial [Bacteroidales bacterium]|nr:OmpA family protein [Bacteroidales bacterium]